MSPIYAKFLSPLKLFFTVFLLFTLTGCVTGDWTQGFRTGPSTAHSGYVTQDPDSIPSMAWQTSGQRNALSRAAQQLATPAEPAEPAQKITVSLLLPLTGKHAHIGQSMLKAAQMALFDVGAARYELVPRDTRSTVDGAARAAAQAVAANNHLILGPVFAEDVKAVKPVAARAGTPVIAFTTDWTAAGGGVYIMGFQPHSQVARIAAHLRAHDLGRLAVFAPQTEYCDVVIDALRRHGAQIVHIGRYSPAQSDLTTIAADFSEQAKAASAQTLFLPVGGEGLRGIVSILDQSGLTNNDMRFAGTGLWDDDSLAANPALYGGLFAAPDPATRRDFEKRYRENYGETPLRLASLAYDATAMSAVLARKTATTDPYNRATLTHARGFAGIDGVFRFRSDGLNERGLAILEIRQGRIAVVDPAPTAFISPGM